MLINDNLDVEGDGSPKRFEYLFSREWGGAGGSFQNVTIKCYKHPIGLSG